MSPGHRFAFGREHAQAARVPQPAPNGDEATGPLPVLCAPAPQTWQDRPTLPLAGMAAPAAPVLPFRAPLLPAPWEAAPVVQPQVEEAAPVVSPQVEMVAAPRRRMGVYVAFGVASLALYSAALMALIAPGHTANTPMVSLAPSAASPPEASASVVAPVASVSAPGPSTTASAPAPVATAPTVPSTPPPLAPARTTHRPAPAHTPQPGSDVHNPWSYE